MRHFFVLLAPPWHLIVSGERHLAPGERRLQLLEVPVHHALVDVLNLLLQREINFEVRAAEMESGQLLETFYHCTAKSRVLLVRLCGGCILSNEGETEG